MRDKILTIFGHVCIIGGCYLVAWGMTLLPHSDPTPLGILARPLFWGCFQYSAASVPTCIPHANVSRQSKLCFIKAG